MLKKWCWAGGRIFGGGGGDEEFVVVIMVEVSGIITRNKNAFQ